MKKLVRKGIMEIKRNEIKEEFLSLTPGQRLDRMNIIFNDIISLKAKTKKRSEREIYKRYLRSYR
jgi:hypothetical protein